MEDVSALAPPAAPTRCVRLFSWDAVAYASGVARDRAVRGELVVGGEPRPLSEPLTLR